MATREQRLAKKRAAKAAKRKAQRATYMGFPELEAERRERDATWRTSIEARWPRRLLEVSSRLFLVATAIAFGFWGLAIVLELARR